MQAFMTQKARPGSRVGATYSLPLSSLSPMELEAEKMRLTMQPRSTYGPAPTSFDVYSVDNGRLTVPRFYGLERFGPAETDERCEGEALSSGTAFHGDLTEVQASAREAVLEHLRTKNHGAMICLPCGYGKTVLAVKLIVDLNRRAIIVVHKAILRDQWIEAFAKFAPTLRVRAVTGSGDLGDLSDVDVLVLMVLSLARREESTQLRRFGTVVCDEAHHIAARIMNQSMLNLASKNVIALTATKERTDGLTRLLHYSLGQEAFRIARNGGESVRVSIAVFPGGTEIKTRDGRPLVAAMVNKLAVNATRNRFIGDRIRSLYARGRTVIVLSDRIQQLNHLRSQLTSHQAIPPEDVGLFTGATKASERTEQLQRRVVLCSFAMASEGLDKREADTLIMATPKANVIQAVGRIQRPSDTKKPPLVIDLADDISIFNQLRQKRERMYRAEKYEIQCLKHDADAEEWFV